MALERLSLAPGSVDADQDINVSDGRPASAGGGDDGVRPPRLPRWTRQEILVLIQGKHVAENRVRRGRAAGMGFGSGQVEPKWTSVSSYCKRHGVDRGPVQCRKRWSNLAGDYKKIKEWESAISEEAESFWVMRNDLRRERKLPGFFDREVYNILEGGAAPETISPAGLVLALPPASEDGREGEEAAAAAEEEEVEAEAVFDSGRSAALEDGIFSDFEQSTQDGAAGGRSPVKEGPSSPTNIAAPLPISEQQFQPFARGHPSEGRTQGKQAASSPEVGDPSCEGRKRRRFVSDGDEETNTLHYQLIDVLEKNGRMLSSHLESQITNSELDREQRKEHMDSLVAVLGKLADALGRIADKL